jgi:luciferase family oxidoreductase group 1
LLLNPDPRSSQHFPQQVAQLHAWVTGEPMPEGHPGHGIRALPMTASAPQVWMLGSSDYGAQLAAHLGLPYAFAHFIADEGADSALRLYRHAFRPGAIEKPHAAICVWALAADTEEEAWHLFASRERARVDRQAGRFGPLLPPGEARRDYSEMEQFHVREVRRKAIVGTPAQVKARLEALAGELEVSEVAVITWTWDPAAQKRSYELLAQAFDMDVRAR